MTIALGIIAHDGIVVAADTEETTGYMKSSQTKILSVLGGMTVGEPNETVSMEYKKDDPLGACAITGAGNSGYIDCIGMKFAEEFAGNPGKDLEYVFGKCLKEFYDEHVIPFAAFPDHDRPQLEMLVAVHRMSRSNLFVTDRSTIRSVQKYKAVGMGSVFAEIILKRLWRPADIPSTQILAAYIAFMAKEHIESCGKYTTVTTLHGPRPFVLTDKGVPLKTVYPDKAITHMAWQEIDDLERIFRKYYAKTEVNAVWNLISEIELSSAQKSKGQQ